MARRALNVGSSVAVTDELVERLAGFYDDPLGFVLFSFPWGEAGTDLEGEDGPDEWQAGVLRDIGEAVRSRLSNPELGAYLDATASGHGVGKTTLVSWIILWFMSTRPDPAIVATANTQGQLNQTTWTELSRWHRRAINADWFAWTATSFYLKTRPETWRANAVPWSKERSEGFQGKHARHMLLIFDEASAIDDSVWEAAEGVLTTSGAIWLAFGNPTRNTGRFRECWRRFRHRWNTRQVDSRTAKKAEKGQLQKWVDDYGEDSDFVRVRVRGEFPRSASTQLIAGELVEEAQREFKRRFGDQVRKALVAGPGGVASMKLDENPIAPRIMSVDVARFGDDQTVIGLRQGKTFVVLAKYRNLDGPQVAYRVAEWINGEQPDAVFLDAVGYGASAYDTLVELGYDIEAVNAGNKALEERKFHNRRAEMWWRMKEWLLDGGAVPDDDKELFDDLTTPEYGYSDRGERVQLETKDDMRARGMPSPDTGDCLAMTFAMPVAPSRARAAIAAKLAGLTFAGRRNAGASWMSN